MNSTNRWFAVALSISLGLSTGCAGMHSKTCSRAHSDHGARDALALAEQFERQGSFAEAKNVYETLITRHSNNPDAYRRLASLSSRIGETQQAEQHYAKAMALAADDCPLLLEVASFYYLSDRLDEAKTVLRKVLTRQPDNKDALNTLARVLGGQQNYEESHALFRRAGNDAQAAAALALMHWERGDLEMAHKHFGKAVRLDPLLMPACKQLLGASFSPTSADEDEIETQVAQEVVGEPEEEESGAVSQSPETSVVSGEVAEDRSPTSGSTAEVGDPAPAVVAGPSLVHPERRSNQAAASAVEPIRATSHVTDASQTIELDLAKPTGGSQTAPATPSVIQADLADQAHRGPSTSAAAPTVELDLAGPAQAPQAAAPPSEIVHAAHVSGQEPSRSAARELKPQEKTSIPVVSASAETPHTGTPSRPSPAKYGEVWVGGKRVSVVEFNTPVVGSAPAPSTPAPVQEKSPAKDAIEPKDSSGRASAMQLLMQVLPNSGLSEPEK